MKIGGNGSKPSYLSYFNLFHLVSTGFYRFLPVSTVLRWKSNWNCSPMNRWGPSDLQQRASQAAALLQPRVSELTGAGGGFVGFFVVMQSWGWFKDDDTCINSPDVLNVRLRDVMCVYKKQDESSFRPEKYCAKLRFSHGFSTFQWNPLDS